MSHAPNGGIVCFLSPGCSQERVILQLWKILESGDQVEGIGRSKCHYARLGSGEGSGSVRLVVICLLQACLQTMALRPYRLPSIRWRTSFQEEGPTRASFLHICPLSQAQRNWRLREWSENPVRKFKGKKLISGTERQASEVGTPKTRKKSSKLMVPAAS